MSVIPVATKISEYNRQRRILQAELERVQGLLPTLTPTRLKFADDDLRDIRRRLQHLDALEEQGRVVDDVVGTDLVAEGGLEDLVLCVPDVVRRALDPYDWGIHGGAVRDTLEGVPYNDLDIFVVCTDKQLSDTLHAHGLIGVMSRTPRGHGFRGLGCDVWSSETQAAVSGVLFGSRQDMARYSFSADCVAVWRDGEFTEAPGASEDIRSKTLRVVVPGMVEEERVQKFLSRGYRYSKREIRYCGETAWLPEPPRPEPSEDPDPSSPWGWYGYEGGEYKWMISRSGEVVGLQCRASPVVFEADT